MGAVACGYSARCLLASGIFEFTQMEWTVLIPSGSAKVVVFFLAFNHKMTAV